MRGQTHKVKDATELVILLTHGLLPHLTDDGPRTVYSGHLAIESVPTDSQLPRAGGIYDGVGLNGVVRRRRENYLFSNVVVLNGRVSVARLKSP